MAIPKPKSLDELIALLQFEPAPFLTHTLILVLALEVKELQKQVVGLKLLIEHEEKVRTSGTVSFGKYEPVVKIGDTVVRKKNAELKGKVLAIRGGRAKVAFGDNTCWVSPRSLQVIVARPNA